MELSYDSAIPFMDIYPKKSKTVIWKNICIAMFIAAVFIIAKIRKQPKGSSLDEWIKKLWYTYTILPGHKKEWNLTTCDRIDGPGEYYAKWNKSDGERQISSCGL